MTYVNTVHIFGFFGTDITIHQMANGGEVANFSVGTDESYTDPRTKKRVKQIEWHRVVAYAPDMLTYLEKHGRKGKMVTVTGKLKTRKWQKDGQTRYSTEIMLAPHGTVRFVNDPHPHSGFGLNPVPVNLELF